MISLKAYLMNRDAEFPPTSEMLAGANDLLERVDSFFHDLGIELEDEDVSSGYRPGRYNKAAGGSPKSSHLNCVALDLKKPIREALIDHFPKWKEATSEDRRKLVKLLDKHKLYLEHLDSTPSWIHLQTRPTKYPIFYP